MRRGCQCPEAGDAGAVEHDDPGQDASADRMRSGAVAAGPGQLPRGPAGDVSRRPSSARRRGHLSVGRRPTLPPSARAGAGGGRRKVWRLLRHDGDGPGQEGRPEAPRTGRGDRRAAGGRARLCRRCSSRRASQWGRASSTFGSATTPWPRRWRRRGPTSGSAWPRSSRAAHDRGRLFEPQRRQADARGPHPLDGDRRRPRPDPPVPRPPGDHRQPPRRLGHPVRDDPLGLEALPRRRGLTPPIPRRNWAGSTGSSAR